MEQNYNATKGMPIEDPRAPHSNATIGNSKYVSL